MDESGFTKLRIAKGVNEALRDVLVRSKSNTSIAQLAEDLLLESCEQILQIGTPDHLLPSVVKLRMRMGLPVRVLPIREFDEYSARVAEDPPPPPPKRGVA